MYDEEHRRCTSQFYFPTDILSFCTLASAVDERVALIPSPLVYLAGGGLGLGGQAARLGHLLEGGGGSGLLVGLGRLLLLNGGLLGALLHLTEEQKQKKEQKETIADESATPSQQSGAQPKAPLIPPISLLLF